MPWLRKGLTVYVFDDSFQRLPIGAKPGEFYALLFWAGGASLGVHGWNVEAEGGRVGRRYN